MVLKKLDAISFEEVIYDNCEACLVIFSRKDCHVCQEVIPMIEELFAKYRDKLGFYYIDVEENKDLYKRFSLKGVPQILFFNHGEYQGKLVGLVEEEDVEAKIVEII
ncbi:MAG: thioredoxin family protein [Dehalobacterium sp.]